MESSHGFCATDFNPILRHFCYLCVPHFNQILLVNSSPNSGEYLDSSDSDVTKSSVLEYLANLNEMVIQICLDSDNSHFMFLYRIEFSFIFEHVEFIIVGCFGVIEH